MEAQNYVQELRERGLTQAQIAARTGIPQPTVSKIMRGAVDDVLSRNYRALQALHAEVVSESLRDQHVPTVAPPPPAIHHDAKGATP